MGAGRFVHNLFKMVNILKFMNNFPFDFSPNPHLAIVYRIETDRFLLMCPFCTNF